MIKRTPRIPMRDLSTLTGEDADTARRTGSVVATSTSSAS